MSLRLRRLWPREVARLIGARLEELSPVFFFDIKKK